MKSLIFGLFVGLALTGCGGTVADYVHQNAPNPEADDGSRAPSSTDVGLQISPGANVVTGGGLKTKFSLAPSARVVQSSSLKVRFSLHQNRPD